MDTQTLQNSLLRVDVNPDNLEVCVTRTDSGLRWGFESNDDGEVVVDHGLTKAPAALREFPRKQFRRYRTRKEERLACIIDGLPGDTGLMVTFALPVDRPDLRIEIEALPTASQSRIREVRFPGPLTFVDGHPEFTAWPNGGGMLLPAASPDEFHKDGKGIESRIAFTREFYAPWWGVVADKGAYVAIVETPFDAALDLRHPSGGPTMTRPVWVPSLGHLAYPRSIRYTFLNEGDHVTLARAYRAYAQDIGRWVSLEEKFDRNPDARRLVGSVIHPAMIYRRDGREGLPPETMMVSFGERVRQVRRLKELGRERALLHIDGWGHHGYDNQHPDPFPPCLEAGGWEGLVELSEAADECGFLFGLHDQYRDYYLDGPRFSELRAVKKADGSLHRWNRWYGGEQTLLCGKESLVDIRRNFAELLGRGVKLSASYMDVFAMVTMDECFDPSHPMTREDCFRWRARGLDYVRSLGFVISSEEPVDCFIPHMDFAHWADYPRQNFLNGRTLGIPAPLHNLVYHDALLLPAVFDLGPDDDQRGVRFLEGLSQVEIPYLNLDWFDADSFKNVDVLASLHAAWGPDELVSHRLLDGEGKIQEFEYSDGSITVDYDSVRYRIEGGPMASKDWIPVDL